MQASNRLAAHLKQGYWIPYAAGLIGVFLLLTAGIRFFAFYKGASLLVPAATCVAAGVAGFVGLRGILTWKDQIERDRLEQNRNAAELYMEAAMKHLPEIQEDLQIQGQIAGRLAAALWGSDKTARAASEFAKFVAAKAESEAELNEIDAAFGSLMLALRVELRGETTLTAEDLVRTVFIK